MAKDKKISTESDKFHQVFGKGSRLELMERGFNIGKLNMRFQKFDPQTNKQLSYIDFYMDIHKALVMAYDIMSGRYAAIAKKKQETNPGEIVEVHKIPGGQSAEKANRPDKKPLYREFVINKGKLWMLKATAGPGAITDNGGIVPDGKPDDVISVGLSDEDLKGIALMIKFHYQGFLSRKSENRAFNEQSDQSVAAQNYGTMMNDAFDF